MYQRNVEAVLAAWNTGNLDGLDNFVDVNYHRIAPASLNQDAQNLDEFKKVVTNFRIAFPDFKVTLDEVHFLNDRMFGRWSAEGTNAGPGDFPATGKKIKITGSSFVRFQKGKTIEEFVYFDVMDMMTQLGLIELPAAHG